jgi:hypothetical protein
MRALHIGLRIQNDCFLRNGSYDFDSFSVIYGKHIPK